MIDTKVQYKFYISPQIYYTKTSDGLFMLYNTKTGESIESNSIACLNLIDRVYEPVNLGVITLNEDELKDAEMSCFIKDIISKSFGNLVEQNEISPRMVNLLPILNLQSDVERLKVNDDFSIGEGLLNYLNELNIYINDSCNQNCPHCDLYFKQVRSCHKESEGKYLELPVIKSILDSLTYSSLKRINILGGNIFLHPHFNDLLKLFGEYDFDFHLWSHYLNLNEKEHRADDILVTFPIKPEIKDYLLADNGEKKIHFLIENESQYAEIENSLSHVKNYNISPVYTGANKEFFQDNIYLNKEDIFGNVIPFRSIFCNQKCNSNYFGKLYILPDGSVKASLNSQIAGNISTNSSLEIIYNELNINTAWRKIRDSKPCNACLYQFLCPPPSNYETVIGKSNLCHVQP